MRSSADFVGDIPRPVTADPWELQLSLAKVVAGLGGICISVVGVKALATAIAAPASASVRESFFGRFGAIPVIRVEDHHI